MASGKVLYSIAVVVLGFICFVVGAIAVGLPNWGRFYSSENPNYEYGYFGPWRVCKILLYNREKCGIDVTKFRPLSVVYYAGVFGAIGVSVLGVFCILSVLQLAMISSKEKVGFKYTHVVMLKMALALLATLLSIVAAGLFASQGDREGIYFLTRGEIFYVQIVCIVINSILFIMSLYDALFSRRAGGDPTNQTGEQPNTTIANPGFKDRRGISMTDASGKPYSTNGHGSVASMNTTATTLTGMSDASTITRSPLRSSLKKPRPREGEPGGLGIQNPGYSGNSPPLNRNGSQKKVRIQTHSTEV